MPIYTTWSDRGAKWGIWKIEESANELRDMLKSDIPYDEELACLRAESRKLEYLAVRVLIALLCGSEKKVGHTPSGKPFLCDENCHITISHTRSYVAVGLHPCLLVGIDIETISERVGNVRSRFLREDERAVGALHLLLHWCAKETMYKLLDSSGVDFLHHLHVVPFHLEKEGAFIGDETYTDEPKQYSLRYKLFPEFVCVWSVDENDTA